LQTARAYAVDDANRAQLHRWGVPESHIEVTGNLAIDGALIEASVPSETGTPQDGVLFMPGSRGYEVEQMIPMFFTSALAMRREDAALPVAFGISPFTQLTDVRAAMMAGGDPRVFAQRGTVVEDDGSAWLATIEGAVRFPVVRNALAAAKHARLIVTIPGTKVIEVAAIGKPSIAISPFNKPEIVTINGPLQYLDRVPLVGVPLKRAAVVAYARRHKYHTQPNIDAQAMLVEEVHSTVTPGRIARIALDRIADTAWLESRAQALGALYREQVGAAARMAGSLLSLTGTK
jgi:lipid A disaccharide synthetase